MSASYDIIIIGGGVNGCALARHAAKKGFAVALFEKNDFGSGVTSRSTRLIHGGLRYLESFQFRVVRESLRDRRALLDEFPGLVAPLPLLIPVYRGDSRPPWYVCAGLTLYKLLARDPELSDWKRLGPKDVELLEPGLDRNGLRAAMRYFDCQAVYPERVALEMALQAEEAGATIRNHSEVTGFIEAGGRIAGVQLGDEEVQGRLVVNAGGAWLDHVRRLGPGGAGRMITRLNGAHIVVRPFDGAPKHGIYHEARSDGRPFFILPWRGLYLIGTTETPFEGDPDRVLATAPEIDYLLTEFDQLFPGVKLSRKDVCYSYAGSRPLIHAEGDMNKASRDHVVYDHEEQNGVAGLLSMVGGKLTTARSFAEHTLGKAARKLGRPDPGPLEVEPGRHFDSDERLFRLYGPRAAQVREVIESDPHLGVPLVDKAGTTPGEIVYTVRHEKARTLADILLRRTGLAFEPDFEIGWAREAAQAVPDWDKAKIDEQVSAFEAELAETLTRS